MLLCSEVAGSALIMLRPSFSGEQQLYPEQDLVWAKLEAQEARIELDEYEKEQRRQCRRRAQEAEDAEKWEQIKEGIAHNNALYPPGDPGHWEPDAWEYAQLHRMWKLQ